MRKNYFLIALAMVFTVNAMAQNIPSYLPKDGLVGYWPFNGNANDESGNGNNGTVNGATLTADRNGVANSAYSFDKSFIDVGNNPNLSITNSGFTVSVWALKTGSSNQWHILGKRKMDVGFQYQLSSNNLPLGLAWGGQTPGENSFIESGTIINSDKWNFFTGTYIQNKWKLYLNGILIDSLIAPLTDNVNTNLLIGSSGIVDNSPFKGIIDDIAIYNRALSQQEITALYNSTPVAQNIPSYVPKDGLVGYWPFNGNANDESGNGNNGTVNGATLTDDRNGKANSSYSFDGSSFISVNKILIPEISISCWFKNNRFDNLFSAIVSKFPDNSNNSFELGEENSNFIKFQVSNNGKDSYAVVTNTINDINPWYHLVASFGNDTLKIYLNNKLINIKLMTGKIFSSTSNIYFGATRDGFTYSYNWFGLLDDIAIYNRALTEQEITALYSGTPTTGLASTKVFVDAPATVNQNDTLELSISTEALNSSDNVIAFQTDFAYDSTKYTYVNNHVVGTLNANGTVVVNSSKNGKLSISYMAQTALNGAGSLVKLKFKANATLGQGIFSLANFMYNNTDITALKSDTVNTIDVVPPTASITYSQNPVRKGDSLLITVKFSETMTDKPAPQVNLAGANTLANTNLTKVNDLTYTYWWVVEKGNGAVNVEITSAKDLAGNNLSKANSNTTFTVLPTLFGDIDTNKFVRAFDAALVLQYSVGLNPLPTMDPLPWSNWRIAVANVDTVGNVTANDASLILQHSAKVITSFPADAKKRGDAPVANITVTQEANQLVFRATGTLYAFNVFMKDNFNAFGQPEVKDKNAMIATNITSTTYNVGLASTTPFTENEPFLVIPILTNENVQGTMDIVANAQEKALAYGKAASIATIQNDAMVVYPNPTKDLVTIKNAQGKTLRIVDFQGRIVNTQIVTSNAHEVSLKAIATKGEYIFQLIGENNETIARQKIVLQ